MYIKLIGNRGISARLMVESKWELFWSKTDTSAFATLIINEDQNKAGTYRYYFELILRDETHVFGSNMDLWLAEVPRNPIDMVTETLFWITEEDSRNDDKRKTVKDWIGTSDCKWLAVCAMDKEQYGITTHGEFDFSINEPKEDDA